MLPEMQCTEDVDAGRCVDSFVVNRCNGFPDHIDVCVSSPSKTARLSQCSDHEHNADEVPVRRLMLVRRSAADTILDSTLDYRLQSLVDVKDDGLTNFTVARFRASSTSKMTV